MTAENKSEKTVMKNFIKKYINDSIDIKASILKDEKFLTNVSSVAKEIIECYKNGGKVLLAGNGGSAADAQHIACEFVSKFCLERQGLPAIALTVNTSVLTAIGNDYGFEKIFSRQVEAIGSKGDIFIGISTSGNSENIIAAMVEAKSKGLKVIGMTGKNHCKMDEICDCILKVPSFETPKIQEVHIMLGHIICAIVEREMFNKE